MISTISSDGYTLATKSKEKLLEENFAQFEKSGYTPTKGSMLNGLSSGDYPHLIFNSNIDQSWIYQYLYESVSWVYACVQRRANAAENAGISIIPIRHKGKVEDNVEKFIETTELFLENCNPEQDFDELIRQAHIDLPVNGKSYLVFDYMEKYPPFRTPKAIYRADFRTMKAVRLHPLLAYMGIPEYEYISKYKNELLGWCQEVITVDDMATFLEPIGRQQGEVNPLRKAPWIVGNGDNIRYFYPEQVIEIRSDASGTSPLKSLSLSLKTELSAQEYTYAYFKNATKTGIVLSMEGKVNKSDAEINKEWIQNEYTNPVNAWKPMLLLGGIKLVRDSANTSDVQYLDIRKFNLVEVCAALGVDPQLFHSEAKSSDKEEAERSFEETTVTPTAKRILKAVTRKFYEIFPEFKGKFKFIPGAKGRASLHLLNIAQKMVMCGATTNESRNLIGFPDVKTDDLYDMPLVAANVMPLETTVSLANAKNVGPNPVKDNNPAGQPRSKSPQDGQTGVNNEQR